VLARGERGVGERRVEVVRRADVDDVDALGGDELLRRVVGALDPQARRRRARALG
jgi:hypothetical protein